MDSGYTTLLNLLQRPNNTLNTLTDVTIHGAIAHYLSVLPLVQLPVFARTLITSQTLWRSRKWDHLSGTKAAMRQAARERHTNILKTARPGFLADPDIATPLEQWVSAILHGQSTATSSFQHLHVKMSLLGGLIQGLEDIRGDLVVNRLQKKVCDQLVRTSTALLDQMQSLRRTVWASDFEKRAPDGENTSILSICLLGINALYISDDDLPQQHLEPLTSTVLTEYLRVFGAGVLSGVDALASDGKGVYSLPENSKLAQDLADLDRSIVYRSLGPLSQLFSRCIRRLSETHKSSGWNQVMDTSRSLLTVSMSIASQWTSSEISAIRDEQKFDPKSRATMEKLWGMLKTYLFSTILISQSIIDVITFQHPAARTSTGANRESSPTIASLILQTLSHVAFISSKFGGVASEGGSFKEQRRLFFGSLDIVGSDSAASESLLDVLGRRTGNLPPSHPVEQSTSAFFLACAEQLTPVVSIDIVETAILPFAKKFLSNPEQREAFESAHSVLLSIFADNGGHTLLGIKDRKAKLASRLIPFYLKSLHENSDERHLSSEQFRLAYHNLVRSASSSHDDASAWLCLEALLGALQDTQDTDQHKRLALTLVSLISAVNLPLLKPTLAAVETELLSKSAEPAHKREMEEEIHDQILSHVGDAQKEVALKWWLDLRERLNLTMEKAEGI